MTHVFIIRFEEKKYHCMMDRKREREGKRILNYKGLLTQYQNLRYLAEGIQSTVWEKKNQCVHLHGGLIYYHGREEIHNRSKKKLSLKGHRSNTTKCRNTTSRKLYFHFCQKLKVRDFILTVNVSFS